MFPEILIIKEKKNLTGDLPACLNLFLFWCQIFQIPVIITLDISRVTSIFILVRSCWMTWEFIREMN